MLNTIQKKKKYFLTFRDSFESLSNQTKIITIETEYIDHTLNKPEVYQLPLKKKVIISKNILKALYLMHKNLFFHLDIKPQNILVDIKSLKIRIIDFDISRKLLPEDSIDKFQVPIRGTVSYAEPSIKELLKSKSLDSKPINISKCDVFSAGVTFF
jgi:serine/threonine protein kinase